MMKVKMMNIVNPLSLDHFDQHSESPPPGGSEISIWGIIYIYTRAQVQTETQSQTYGGAFVSFSFVGFGVLADGLTTAPTFCVCVGLCRLLERSLFLFRISCEKRGTITPPNLPTYTHILPQSAHCYAYLCALGVVFMLNRSSDDQNASICTLAIAESECRHMFASLTKNNLTDENPHELR